MGKKPKPDYEDVVLRVHKAKQSSCSICHMKLGDIYCAYSDIHPKEFNALCDVCYDRTMKALMLVVRLAELGKNEIKELV